MKQVFTGTCLAAAFAVGLSAQTPQTPMQDTKDAAKDAAKTVTVSGCLKAGDSSDSFILSDLKFGSPSSAVGTSGTAGATGAGAPPAALASATTLTIKPKGDTKLSEHVGHQVEVSGNVSDKSASAAPAAPADPAAPAARPSAGASSGPTLEARTVKMIAATCSM
jgi:hypothetical protein